MNIMQCNTHSTYMNNTLKVWRTFANYSLLVQEWLHQQACKKARRTGVATGIWWLHSACTAAGWSSGLACPGWSRQEAEDSQAVEGRGLCPLTWWWQLEATGEHNLCWFLLSSADSVAFVCQLIGGSEGTPAHFFHSPHTRQCDLLT